MGNIEKDTAEYFARDMQLMSYNLDFSYTSLENEIDKILRSKSVELGDKARSGWKNQAGLEAYVGETLRRLYDGQWNGEFNSENPGGNFYSSYVQFGEYKFFPSHFLGYRISNSEKSEGTFQNFLARLMPNIKNRENIK